jgi:hypothetical protein
LLAGVIIADPGADLNWRERGGNENRRISVLGIVRPQSAFNGALQAEHLTAPFSNRIILSGNSVVMPGLIRHPENHWIPTSAGMTM